jgi:hypothetical protein
VKISRPLISSFSPTAGEQGDLGDRLVTFELVYLYAVGLSTRNTGALGCNDLRAPGPGAIFLCKEDRAVNRSVQMVESGNEADASSVNTSCSFGLSRSFGVRRSWK